MRFLVYSSPRGSKEHDIERMLLKECDSFDEAMSWACHVKSSGRMTQFIKGDDGTHLVK